MMAKYMLLCVVTTLIHPTLWWKHMLGLYATMIASSCCRVTPFPVPPHNLLSLPYRMYVLDHRMKLHPLRLSDPNDDLGGMMYPSIPQDILHHIDHHSALGPRRMPLVEGDHCLVLRTIDSATCNREEISCPVCGEVSCQSGVFNDS